MIEKQCQYSGESDVGVHFHLLHPGYDDCIEMVKEAHVSAPLLDDVKKFMKAAPKDEGKVMALLSALGAGEYWGSNTNGDYFPHHSLIHAPQGWQDLSTSMRRMTGSKWEWGYPTFYNAYAYQHHVNKDPARAFGNVEYATWDPQMRRVLLVVGVSRKKAQEQGAYGVVDRIDNGEFPDVSMGCRVPFDLCSICTDWSRITGNPRKDLAEHRRKPIRGLSVTTKDYCQHLQFETGRIYPDGRRVWMWNLHPKFFDISFVFIGADKSSKVMAKLAVGQCPIKIDSPMCKAGCTKCSPHGAVLSSHIHDVWSREKTAMELTPFEEYVVQHNRDDRDAGEIQDISKQEMARLKKEWEAKEKTAGPIMNAALKQGGEFLKARKKAREAKLSAVHEKAAGYRAFPEFEDPEDEVRINKIIDRQRRKLSRPGFTTRSHQEKVVKIGMADLEQAFAVGPQKLADLSFDKKAEIIKRIQSHFNKSLSSVAKEEPDIPKDTLDEMSECPGRSLGTAAGMGIVLKPREFQRVMVRSMGHNDLADKLDDAGACFEPGADADAAPGMQLAPDFLPRLIKMLGPLMEGRSAYGPPLKRRVLKITIVKHVPKDESRMIQHPLLDKVSGAYQAYRQEVMQKVASLVPKALHEYPGLYAEIVSEEDLFLKEGAGLVKAGGDVIQSFLGMFPATYLNGVYMPGPVSRYVADHPSYAGLREVNALAGRGGAA